MKRQNRTLIFVFVFVLGLVAIVLSKTGAMNSAKDSKAVEIKDEAGGNIPEPTQEAMGERVEDTAANRALGDEQKTFSLILTDLNNCFDLKNGAMSEAAPVSIESVFGAVQTEMGPALAQADRAMNWHLKNKEGLERRVRLEITELDDGQMLRELKYFAVDNEGLPIPMELPPDRRVNPSDEVINQMLKEGDVFYKEKAAYAVFSGGARVEFMEKNGTLSELEFQKGNRYFRCQSLKTRDGCQCVR